MQPPYKYVLSRNHRQNINLTTQLRRAGIPYNVTRVDRPDQAIESYAGAIVKFLSPAVPFWLVNGIYWKTATLI